MEIKSLNILDELENSEIDILLTMYYTKDRLLNENSIASQNLLTKNLISTEIEKNQTKMTLTDLGLSLCGEILKKNISKKEEEFYELVENLPERAISFLVNRIVYHSPLTTEMGHIEPVNESYSLDNNLWFERVLLKNDNFINLMKEFYLKLENLGFIKNLNGKRYSSPEVETFLKNKYKNVIDLSWAEEDSLKYFYFFYIYAQDQKNLINFSGEKEDYKSMFYGENSSPPDYWFSSNRSDPQELLSNLALSQKRVISFLDEMKGQNIVNERYYPLSSFSFFDDEDRIYVIQDIKKYMSFINTEFLDPVANSLLNL